MTSKPNSTPFGIIADVVDALLRVCDGAQELDGQGFNKPDSQVIRSAYPDMIVIAPLLLKYKKQIEAEGFNFKVLEEAVVAVAGPRPTHNWGEHRLGFGKYSERTYEEMAQDQRGYLSWMVQTFNHDDPKWIAANAVLSEIPIQIQSLTEMATQTTSDFGLEHFGNGKEMLPFQKAGLEFAEATDGNLLIADQMGLGKTVEALSYLALHPEMRPAVVVCPASLKLNWKKEAEDWLETDGIIEVIRGGKVHELNADIIIINYDILKKWTQVLQGIRPQVIIFDESHALKNPKSQRSKAAKELAGDIPHKILLTGTPILSRPSELWNQLQIIQPFEYSNKRFFKWHLRYAAAHKIKIGYNKTAWDFSGASNLDELAKSLKTIMLRRTKEQALPELPEKRRSTVLIDIDNRKEYDHANNEFVEWLTEQKELHYASRCAIHKVDWNNPESDESDAVRTSLAIQGQVERASHVEQLAKIEYLRQIAVAGKMKQALAWIENFLESGEKLVVFTVHKATIHALEREYGNTAVKIDGSVSSEKRQAAVNAFQNDPNVRLFIGNIQAAGVGITLTAASNVVFLELSWTPALHEQAEDRCHRIGQKNAVNIYYLLAANTVDASIAALLESKREVIDKIVEEENGIGFDLFDLIKED